MTEHLGAQLLAHLRVPAHADPKRRAAVSVERVDMYRVLCDRCGQPDDSDYYAWTEPDQAIDVARESEWSIIDDDGQYCPGCVEWDEEADELRPKPIGDPKGGGGDE